MSPGFIFKIGKDVERIEMPHICDKCFRGEHGSVCGENMLGKACMCICNEMSLND